MNNRIFFIGPIDKNNIPIGGQIAKCQEVEFYLNENKIPCDLLDTYGKSKAHLGLKIFLSSIFDRKSFFLIALSSKSAVIVAIILAITFSLKRSGYMVVGNWFPTFIKKRRYLFPVLKRFKFITTEGISTSRELRDLGLPNTYYHPNFKRKIFNLDFKSFEISDKDVVRILFLSRVCSDKGVDLAIEAVNKINESKVFKYNLEIDIYGKIDPFYKSKFNSLLNSSEHVRYCGEIDLKVSENYEYLADKEYYCFVFPTIYIGEGFAGVFIDCMTLGIPVICTEWNLNSEIITNYKNGLIVDHNANSIKDGISWMLLNLKMRNQMANNQLMNRENFESKVVLSDILRLYAY